MIVRLLLALVCAASLHGAADNARLDLLRERVANRLGSGFSTDLDVRVASDGSIGNPRGDAVREQLLPGLAKIAARSAVEFTFTNTADTFDAVSLRMTIFAADADAAEFFRQKYREHADFAVIDQRNVLGKALGKRAALQGAVVISVLKAGRDDALTGELIRIAADALLGD